LDSSETLRGALRVTQKEYRKIFHPARGFLQTFHLPKEALCPRLISNGGKMERMPLPCAMGLALDAFKKFSHQKGEF